MPPTVQEFMKDMQERKKVYRIERIDSAKFTSINEGIAIECRVDGTAKRFEMADDAVIRWAGVPQGMVEKLDRDLLCKIAENLVRIDHNGKFSMLSGGNHAISFQKYSAPFIPAFDLFETVFDHVAGGDFEIHDIQITPERVDVDFMHKTYNVQPKIETGTHRFIDELLRLGIHYSYYDSSFKPAVVEGYTVRQTCSNGMVRRFIVKGYEINAEGPSALREQVVARSIQVMEDLPKQIIAECQKLMSVDVAHPAAAVNRMAADMRVNQEVLEGAHEALAEEPGATMWHIANAFTRAANRLGDYDDRNQVRLRAGRAFLEHAGDPRCGSCFRPMR